MTAPKGHGVTDKPAPPVNKKYRDRFNNVEIMVSCDTTPVMVCSVYPKTFAPDSQFNVRPLPALEKDYDYSFCWIGPGFRRTDFGEGKRIKDYRITARKVAEDIFGRKTYIERGVFIAAGDEPTWDEINAAIARRNQFLREALIRGRAAFQRTGRIADVDDAAKIAARFFNESVPWSPGANTTSECPACAEPVRENAVKCKSCGYVINKQKALELGILTAAEKRELGLVTNLPPPPAKEQAKGASG